MASLKITLQSSMLIEDFAVADSVGQLVQSLSAYFNESVSAEAWPEKEISNKSFLQNIAP